MAATVQIISLHGATGATETQVDGGTARFKAADNDTADVNNPLVIPTGADIYSYVKQFRFKVTVTPSNTIDNLAFYTDGASGMGTGVDIGVKTLAFASYIDPTSQMQTQVAGLTSAFTYTAGEANDLDITGSLTNPSTGFVGDMLVAQMSVTNGASQGTTPSETFTFSYDES